jgi:hypothetical protein
MNTRQIFNQKSGIMRSSTFQDPHPQNRCRAKDSGPKTPLLTMLTVFIMAFFMQVGNLQAQNLYTQCTGCVSEDIKATTIRFDPGLGNTCLNLDDEYDAQLYVGLDVTSNTRYGLYIEFSIEADGEPFNGGARYAFCIKKDLPQGQYEELVGTIPGLPGGVSIRLYDVFTAWENQDPDVGNGDGTYFCDKPTLVCSDVDKPRCKTYLFLGETVITGKPTVNVSGPEVVCAGTTEANDAQFTITGTPSTAGANITLFWSKTGGAPYTQVNNFDGSYNVDADPLLSETLTAYLVRGFGTPGACQGDDDEFTITVNTPASVAAITPQTVCADQTIQLAVTSSPTSGAWSGGADAGFNPNRTTPNAIYTPTSAEKMAGSVTLTWTTTNPDGPCEAASGMVTHTILPIVVVEAGANATYCQDPGAISLSGTSVRQGMTVLTGQWTIQSQNPVAPPVAGTFSNNGFVADGAGVTFTPAAGFYGTIVLRLTSEDPANACGAKWDEKTITINQESTADAGDDVTICANQTVMLDASSVPATGSWSGGGGSYSNTDETTPTATYAPSSAEKMAGTVTLTWTTTDPDGDGPCTAASDMVTITIQALPIANAGTPQTTCVGEAVNISGSVTGGPYTSIEWKAPMGSGTFGNASSLNTTFTPSITGDITLTLEVTPTAPCVTKVTSTVVITSETCEGVGFCTYTQGYFGQDRGNGRAHYLVGDDCVSTTAAGTITAALKGWGDGGMHLSNMIFKWNVPTDVAKIAEYLPGGGPAAAYPGTKDGLTASSPKNILLAQTMTLGLNLGLNGGLTAPGSLGQFTLQTGMLYTIPSSDCGVTGSGEGQCFAFDVDGLPNLNGIPGIQVEDIWKAANLALKGAPEAASWSKSKLAGAAGSVNEAFDECRVERGWDRRECSDDVTKINPESLLLTESFEAVNSANAKSLTVKAFPNPFKDRVTIQFTSPVSGKAVVEIFDMTGRRLEMINKGQVIAGRVNTVDYTVPATNRNSIIYKVTVDKFSVNGRLISPGK